jgi:hypothetical protein
MVQLAEIIRISRFQYFESGEAFRTSAINGGMLEDTALDILAELPDEDADAMPLDEGDFFNLAGLHFNSSEGLIPVHGVSARFQGFRAPLET